jgi:molecular chaperone DnaK
LAYGHTLNENKKILVFDLGGGTFDVTILEVIKGDNKVIASDGADQLGGKDWDELIIEFLYSEYHKLSGNHIPDDMGWEIQQKALIAKYELSDNDQTIVTISSEGDDVEIILYQTNNNKGASDFDMDNEVLFYFDERSENLLSLCRAICSRLLEKAGISWGDIDDIVLAGGSCRMPMIPKMLEELTGRKIPRNIPGFSYDTSIAIGAALSGSRIGSVQDVTSRTIGIEVQYGGSPYIEHLIAKNKPIPIFIEESFKAEGNAVLKVYEGDSHRPDECILRGKLELGNPEGDVKVKMNVGEDGVLSSVVEYPPNYQRELKIKTDDADVDLEELRGRIAGIDIRL